MKSLVELLPAPAPDTVSRCEWLSRWGVPVSVLAAIGFPDIGLLTAPGAFTVLYVAQAAPNQRAKVLPFIVLGLMLNALAGVLLAPWY